MNHPVTDKPKIDKLPPHDIEAERALLGSILLSPDDCMDECAEKLAPDRAAFYDLRHQLIYAALTDLREQHTTIDLVTLQAQLRKIGFLEQVGGMAYLVELSGCSVSPTTIGHYIEIVLEQYILRKVLQVSVGIEKRAIDFKGNVREFLNESEKEFLSIANFLDRSRGTADLGELYQELVNDYENALSGVRSGLSTGFLDLDETIGGMKPQEMIVLAGQQSTGKTSLVMNIASNVAFAGDKVGVLSLETSAKKLLHRMFCAQGHIDGSQFLRGKNIIQDHFQRMATAANQVLKIKDRFLIDDSGGLTIEQVVSKARRMRQQGASLIIIDYLQLIGVRGANTDVERITEISRSVKGIAKENNCPVLIISSLNRDAAKGERRPAMHDLRGSGQIEYDGNQVWLLSCDNTEATMRDVKLNVSKNKDGPTGLVNLLFFASQFRFANVAKNEQPERRYND